MLILKLMANYSVLMPSNAVRVVGYRLAKKCAVLSADCVFYTLNTGLQVFHTGRK
jgi:hypothetical protein